MRACVSDFGLDRLEQHARFLLSEVLLALAFVHEAGFVFRDLKPTNVLVGLDGHVRLGDFGIAKEGESGCSGGGGGGRVALRTNSFVGTLEYPPSPRLAHLY